MYLTNTNTICAIATPPGIGAISMIRISGNETLETLKKITKREEFSIRKAHYCEIFSNSGELLDDAVVIYYKSPHSYTGEDVAEIFCLLYTSILSLVHPMITNGALEIKV